MAGALRAALCSGLLLLVSGTVPEPRNVRITSVNLHSTLQWDAPRFPRGNLTYTVQSKSIYYPGDTYETLGTDLRLPQCDVSSLSPYGIYVLRLRAEAGQLHSPWLSLTFKPMDDSCAEGYARDATEIQNIQIADGDVCRGLPIPIHMVFPRLFTCPTLETTNFKVEFEVNIVVLLHDDHLITENFPLKLCRM